MLTPSIENATSFETAIDIVPEEECWLGVYFLQREYVKLLTRLQSRVSLVHIKDGGNEIGEQLRQANSTLSVLNPMRMSHTGPDNKYLPDAVCKEDPDLSKILMLNGEVLPVVFAEAIVETQGTIIGAIARINHLIDVYNGQHMNHYAYPKYHTFALASKINGEINIPNLIYAFRAHPDIWLHGWEADDEKKGRDIRSLRGRLSPHATATPKPPYYRKNF